MKRVLIIAPDFLPSSYPPALRIKLFASHLSTFGWEPIIVSVQPRYYEWGTDRELEKLIPDSVEVFRTAAFEARLTRKIGVGDIGIRSLWHQWIALKQICSERRPNLILIPIPPYWSALLANMSHKRFGIPYVIDYIDPWVNTSYGQLIREGQSAKRVVAHTVSCLVEPAVLREASHLVAVSQGTIDKVRMRYAWTSGIPGTEIPYGGEPSDFDYLHVHPRANKAFDPKDGFFHVSSVGRGGRDLEVALNAIFQALQSGLKRSSEIFSKLRMHFIGTSYAPQANGSYQVLPLAEKNGVQDFVIEHPARVSYLDALKILIDSHALLAIGSDQIHYTASKIFPYILARKSLLAIFHEESSVVRILSETGAGRAVTFTNEHPPTEKVEEISKHLEEILSLPRDYIPPTSWDAFERYTARAMTERLAKVFDQVISI